MSTTSMVCHLQSLSTRRELLAILAPPLARRLRYMTTSAFSTLERDVPIATTVAGPSNVRPCNRSRFDHELAEGAEVDDSRSRGS